MSKYIDTEIKAFNVGKFVEDNIPSHVEFDYNNNDESLRFYLSYGGKQVDHSFMWSELKTLKGDIDSIIVYHTDRRIREVTK